MPVSPPSLRVAAPLATGLAFGECPRWHAGRWWLSDFYDHAVFAVDPRTGAADRVVDVPARPAGLGWLPDGRLLVASMVDRRILRREPDGRLLEHANVAGLATFHVNDLVVDGAGRAYVGNFGFDLAEELRRRGVPSVVAEHPTAVLVRVDPDGSVHAVAEGLSFPNGMALVDGGRTLLVAETIAFRVTAFDVAGDGGLSNRRVFAAPAPGPHGPRAPDGLAADLEGGVWFANALARECVRVDAAGRVTDVVEVDEGARCFGCALGGPSGRTLAITGADSDDPEVAAAVRTGRLWVAEVDVSAG